ncbi:hypothetical protein DEJ24_04950 [Curtobacterium sp. MCPF17_001]|uniref:glycosyltransferase family 4 protein n=1 Tax=Curtobacterium sp. MCPF17_001 TaxID=2175651 RepID=UPI000DA70034|nr:glycosyltransferase family 4 protein [Curtobacterium sp. MCPF17_001]PZE61606.1 hypothetical protein DEJ24_04950 [Curtobacterium sp. MCPF17_001]
MARIAIIHPWLPQYRLPFFSSLREQGAAAGHDVEIFYGTVPPEWEARGDAVEAPKIAEELSTKWLKIGPLSLALRSLRPLRRNGPFDLIIVEQAVRNLETYQLAVSGLAPRIAMWGHGRTYTKPTPAFQEKLKHTLTQRSDWFFAYTQGGADHVVSGGYPSERTTVVLNTIDSRGLAEAVDTVAEDAVHAFKHLHNLGDRNAVFIGGLDESKRLNFLLASGDAIAAQHSSFRLLVIGDGNLKEWLSREAVNRPWLTLLGHATGEVKALALSVSRAILMPGRVGLVAVDSFAAKVPIVTTHYPWHAPEFEYLEDDRNAVVTDDDVQSYSEGVAHLFDSDDLHRRLVQQCGQDSERYSVDAMAARFLGGIELVLKTPARRGPLWCNKLRIVR